MSTFTYDWDINQPVAADAANQLDVFIRNEVKRALDERLGLEHYNSVDGSNTIEDASAVGRHKPGYVASVLVDTDANIQLVTPTGSGALAWATDTMTLYVWDGASWIPVLVRGFSSDGLVTEETGTGSNVNPGSADYVTVSVLTPSYEEIVTADVVISVANTPVLVQVTGVVRIDGLSNTGVHVALLDDDDAVVDQIYVNDGTPTATDVGRTFPFAFSYAGLLADVETHTFKVKANKTLLGSLVKVFARIQILKLGV